MTGGEEREAAHGARWRRWSFGGVPATMRRASSRTREGDARGEGDVASSPWEAALEAMVRSSAGGGKITIERERGDDLMGMS